VVPTIQLVGVQSPLEYEYEGGSRSEPVESTPPLTTMLRQWSW
jgi:hypothetical protein